MRRDDHTTARLLVDGDCFIAECTPALATMMRTTPAALIGTHALKIVAPADRDRCTTIFNQIRIDGVRVVTTRRVVRADRTYIWVRIAFSSLHPALTDGVQMDVEECGAPAPWAEPALLLKVAADMMRARRARVAIFGAGIFSDYAWDLLLATYIAESEGSVVSLPAVSAMIGASPLIASRWLDALRADDLIVLEDGGPIDTATPSLRLSAAAHQKMERFLSGSYRKSVNGGKPGMTESDPGSRNTTDAR